MKLKVLLVLLVVLVISSAFAVTSYFKEIFEDHIFNNTAKTTADWNTIDEIGSPGRLSARQVALVSTAAGRPVDVATNGKYVFVAMSGTGGMAIINAQSHLLMRTLATGDNEQGIDIDGRYAYTVDDGGEITKVDCGDVTTPTLPYSVNSDLAGTDLRAVAVANGWLYIASDAGLIAKNGYDGGSFPVATTNAQDVAIYGPYILLADGNGGLRVYSHTNPAAAPSAVGSIVLPDCRGVSVYGTYALVAAGDSVFIVNLTNPASPTATARLGSAGDCNSVCEQSGKLYAACGASGTMVYVGADFASMRPIGMSPNAGGGSATSLVSVMHEVAVADNTGGAVQFLSQGNDISPPAGWTDSEATAHSMPVGAIVHGDYLYVSEQTYGLITYDLTTLSVVDELEVPDGSAAMGLAASGNYLLHGIAKGGLRCYSLADPSNPSVLWTETAIGGAEAEVLDVACNGCYAYVSVCGFGTLGVYKIPILGGSHSAVASWASGSSVYDVEVNGDIIYAAATGLGLAALDLDLGLIETHAFGGGSCWGVITENDYAYVNLHNGGFSTVDISDVGGGTGMVTSDNLDLSEVGNVLSISRFDKYICIGEDDASQHLQFLDVSDPTALPTPSTSLGGVAVPGGLSIPSSMVKWGKNLVLIDYLAGVRKWETYPNDCTDSLIGNSVLHSTEISGATTGIRFANWWSWEFYPGDDKDTCDSYIYYSKVGSQDSLRLIYYPIDGYYEYQRPIPPFWASESWYWLDGLLGTGFDDLYWYIEITDSHDVWTDPDSTEVSPEIWDYSGVWFIDSLKIGYGNGDWPGTRSGRSLTLDFDFGGGETQELVIEMDSNATDRYDPGMDIPFVPGPIRPNAYWALDDPDGPEGVGLSVCYVPAHVGARPVRLILSHPATVTWMIAPDSYEGSFILDDIDLASETSMDLPAGEFLLLPGGGFAIFFQNHLERGWNMVAPKSLPLTVSPTEMFDAFPADVWSYDDAFGGYFNPEEIEEGKGYFVFSNSPKISDYWGIYNDWIRTKIHSGWNIISGPAAGRVHVSNLITRPEDALWSGPIYHLTPSGYDAVEWLEPGKAYWAFGIEDAELFADTVDYGRRRALGLGSPEFAARLNLRSGQFATELILGVHSAASDAADSRYDRLQPPTRPDGRNIGHLSCDGAPTPLSTSVRGEAGWTLHVSQSCVASSDLPLTATRDGESYAIDIVGTQLPSGTYRVDLSKSRLPEMMAITIYPNPFNTMALVRFVTPAAGRGNLSAYDISGRKVATLFDGDVIAGTNSTVWRGCDDLGRSLPSGVYFLRFKVNDDLKISTKAVLLK